MLTVFLTNNANAQIKAGPIAGIQFTDVTGDDPSDGFLVGFHFGFLVNFGITDYLMFEPQLLYSMRGAQGNKNIGDLKMNYIEIPMWLRYQLSNGVNFNAGPYAGILVSAKQDGEDMKDLFKTFDFGLGVGLGYQTSGGFGLAANYSQGIVNIGDDITVITPFGPISQSFDAKNTCIRLSISYTFGGRRE